VFDHHLERLATQEHVTQDDIVSDRFTPYVRLYHNEARSNAHLYIRYQALDTAADSAKVKDRVQASGPYESETYSDRLKSVVRFREIPPGALGGVTVIAWASTVIIYFFALTRLGLDIEAANVNGVRTIVKADMPALLLALPAFSGVLIGALLDQSRLRRTSVTTYVALACVMSISIFSALYFIYDSGKDFPIGLSFILPGTFSLETDLIWVCLMVLSSALALFLVKELYSQGRLYFGMVRNRIDKDSVRLLQLRRESSS
jgi:hypothetical protein